MLAFSLLLGLGQTQTAYQAQYGEKLLKAGAETVGMVRDEQDHELSVPCSEGTAPRAQLRGLSTSQLHPTRSRALAAPQYWRASLRTSLIAVSRFTPGGVGAL